MLNYSGAQVQSRSPFVPIGRCKKNKNKKGKANTWAAQLSSYLNEFPPFFTFFCCVSLTMAVGIRVGVCSTHALHTVSPSSATSRPIQRTSPASLSFSNDADVGRRLEENLKENNFILKVKPTAPGPSQRHFLSLKTMCLLCVNIM